MTAAGRGNAGSLQWSLTEHVSHTWRYAQKANTGVNGRHKLDSMFSLVTLLLVLFLKEKEYELSGENLGLFGQQERI